MSNSSLKVFVQIFTKDDLNIDFRNNIHIQDNEYYGVEMKLHVHVI